MACVLHSRLGDSVPFGRAHGEAYVAPLSFPIRYCVHPCLTAAEIRLLRMGTLANTLSGASQKRITSGFTQRHFRFKGQ